MFNIGKDIDSKITEAEERNAGEAKVVEATDFHPVGAGSIPVTSTKNMNVNKFGKNIDCGFITWNIAGRDYTRLKPFW